MEVKYYFTSTVNIWDTLLLLVNTTSLFDAANRLASTSGTGASTYTSDPDGNTLSGGGRTNSWDSQNRLVSCIVGGNTSASKYGADGLRR